MKAENGAQLGSVLMSYQGKLTCPQITVFAEMYADYII